MPIVLHRTLMRDTQLGLWEITEDLATLQAKLQLDKAEREYLGKIKAEKKKAQWLASRCLIRYMLNTPEFVLMKATEAGKPFFPELNHHVSVSHSGNYAAAMISLNRSVGMDIETVTDKILLIHHKFVNEQESEFVKSDDVMANIVAWSAKETLFKWYGKGQVDFRRNITLHPFKLSGRGVIKAAFAKPDCSKLLSVEYEAGPELVMTWVEG